MTPPEISAELLTINLRSALVGEPVVRTGSEAMSARTYATALELSHEPGVWLVSINRAHRPRWTGRLALAALRRAGIEPHFVVPSPVSYRVSVDGAGADYALPDWLARQDFTAELAELDARTEGCNASNQRIADSLAQHPVNLAALVHINRELAARAANATSVAS